ncbi:hypothetical protein B4098_0544 [Heyndrickxia coagulans]|uniref:Uncharacterized protein n=1 Tax=Heyndrickxia coagulans TaxID=1398 RepID=A0A150K5P3_HEYCO|nr:hypothetical protein BCO26_0649 [Heyndrickxia coagulans 2-6]KYC64870.1 hypothetical protein B4098_0544 [Heyndrickxia coagulans]
MSIAGEVGKWGGPVPNGFGKKPVRMHGLQLLIQSRIGRRG